MSEVHCQAVHQSESRDSISLEVLRENPYVQTLLFRHFDTGRAKALSYFTSSVAHYFIVNQFGNFKSIKLRSQSIPHI